MLQETLVAVTGWVDVETRICRSLEHGWFSLEQQLNSSHIRLLEKSGSWFCTRSVSSCDCTLDLAWCYVSRAAGSTCASICSWCQEMWQNKTSRERERDLKGKEWGERREPHRKWGEGQKESDVGDRETIWEEDRKKCSGRNLKWQMTTSTRAFKLKFPKCPLTSQKFTASEEQGSQHPILSPLGEETPTNQNILVHTICPPRIGVWGRAAW